MDVPSVPTVYASSDGDNNDDNDNNDNSRTGSQSSSNGGSSNSPYTVTVSIGQHPFGDRDTDIYVITENGYRDSANVANSGSAQHTFNIPGGQGNSIKVCASAGIIEKDICETYQAGSSFSVSFDVTGDIF